jgi:hypothetical protein
MALGRQQIRIARAEDAFRPYASNQIWPKGHATDAATSSSLRMRKRLYTIGATYFMIFRRQGARWIGRLLALFQDNA